MVSKVVLMLNQRDIEDVLAERFDVDLDDINIIVDIDPDYGLKEVRAEIVKSREERSVR